MRATCPVGCRNKFGMTKVVKVFVIIPNLATRNFPPLSVRTHNGYKFGMTKVVKVFVIIPNLATRNPNPIISSPQYYYSSIPLSNPVSIFHHNEIPKLPALHQYLFFQIHQQNAVQIRLRLRLLPVYAPHHLLF
jgi:hypothetical protein